MFFSIIFLVGAIHGVALSLLLVTKKVNQLSNRILGVLMFIFAIDLMMAAYQGLGLYQQYPHFIGLDYTITMLYGPLLYLYAETLIRGGKRLNKWEWAHFIPFLAFLMYSLPVYFSSADEKITLLDANGGLQYGPDFITHLKVGYNLIYIPFILRLLYSFRKKVKASYSSLDRKNLDWLQGFVLGGFLMALAATILHTLNSVYGANPMYSNLTLLGVTVYVYSIGYMGLRQPEFFAPVLDDIASKKHPAKETAAYSKSGLSEEKGKQLMDKLRKLMETEKLYTNNELSLRELSDRMEITPHNLTEIINRFAGKNFYDFVNSYRVEEVKRRLKQADSKKLTVLALGMEAGFNSKSTFNSVFKKHTGMTPTEFKQTLQKQE